MLKTKKTKKAQVGTTITLIAATIVITLLLVLFLAGTNTIAKFRFSEKKEVKYSMMQQEIVSLEGYLATPLKGIYEEEREIKMEDLIRLWDASEEKKQDYRDKIEEATSKIFSTYAKSEGNSENSCYFLRIESASDRLEIGDRGIEFFKKGESMSLQLPAPNNVVNITFTLNKKCFNEDEN
jgi:hypothetical protein